MNAFKKPLSTLPSRNTLRQHIVERLREVVLSGEVPPGTQLVESQLAEQLGVSRGPVREAMRELAEEGLVMNAPYQGTFVAELTVKEIEEIYSLRTVLEVFAFELAWPRRDRNFRQEIDRRHAGLLSAIKLADPNVSIRAELHLHGLAYEWSDHALLQSYWQSLKSRLHFYLAVHQRAHGREGPKSDAHVNYVALAKGQDFEAMAAEIRHHMRRGLENVKRFVSGRRS